MGMSGLLAGIGLVWLLGSLLLHRALTLGGESLASRSLPFLLGHGFFVGYGLFIPLWAGLPGVERLPVAGVLALLLLANVGLVAWAWPTLRPLAPRCSLTLRSHPWLLLPLAAILLHLLFALHQILTNPIMPWDAWSTWAYRARVWFLGGGIHPFVSASEWRSAADPALYTIGAHHYPDFVSLLYLWSARTLGAWHEGLIGLPWWCCGIAIALALHGHARIAGLRPLPALLLVWLLLSIPLFNVHIALHGYADLWQAGFSGLGLAALITGILRSQRGLWWSGLALVLLGSAVKLEGAVWCLLALWLLLVQLAMRGKGWGAAVAALLAITLLLLGTGGGSLPGLGRIGVEGGVLHLGPLGAMALTYHPVAATLLENLFNQGSWHLFGLLPPLILIAAVGSQNRRQALPLIAFIGGTLVILAGIFLFSQQGAFVSGQTAFNRVLLHLAPALVLALVHLDAVRSLHRQGWPRYRLAGVVFLGVSALLLTLQVASFTLQQGSTPAASARTLDLRRWQVAQGAVTIDEKGFTLSRYREGRAALVSPPLLVKAADYPLLSIDLGRAAPGAGEIHLFWRLREAREVIHLYRLSHTGHLLLPLAEHPEWRGEVIQLGIELRGQQPHRQPLERFALLPATPTHALSALVGAWSSPEGRTPASINRLLGGSEARILSLTALLLAAIGISALVWLLWRSPGHRERALPSPAEGWMVALLIGWLLLDLQWLNSASHWAVQSEMTYGGRPVEARWPVAEEAWLSRYLERLRREELPQRPVRLLVHLPGPSNGVLWLRTRYRLAPHNLFWLQGKPDRTTLREGDYLLWMGDPGASGFEGLPSGEGSYRLADGSRVTARLEDRDPLGLLFQLGTPPPQPDSE